MTTNNNIEPLNNPLLKDKEILFVIKIGGNIIDDELKLSSFLKNFATIKHNKILIHGGGKLATKVAEAMGIQQQMIDGRRITDAETLKVVTMVYAGAINKNIVAQLQANNCNAIGLSGADANVIQAHKRGSKALSIGEGLGEVDYGFVGDVDMVNTSFINALLMQNITVVLSPITHNKEGVLLNTNADTIAQEVAKAMVNLYKVQLVYSFEKEGVLLNVNDDSSVISTITKKYYQELKNPPQGIEAKIFAGMIPKLDNAFAALESGVEKVIIGKAEKLHQLLKAEAGTTLKLK